MVMLMLLWGCATQPPPPAGYTVEDVSWRQSDLRDCATGNEQRCYGGGEDCLDGRHGPRDLACVRDTAGDWCEAHPDSESCTVWGEALVVLGGQEQQGLALLERTCTQYHKACSRWAWVIHDRDPKRAHDIAAKACADNERFACDRLALIDAFDGDVTQADVDAVREGCLTRNTRFLCEALGEIAIEDVDDPERGLELIGNACLSDDGPYPDQSQGCAREGWHRWRHVTKPISHMANVNITITLWQACNSGDAEGCYGMYYAFAHPELGVVPSDHSRTAADYLARACNLGMAEACGDPAKLPNPLAVTSGWDGGFRRGGPAAR